LIFILQNLRMSALYWHNKLMETATQHKNIK